MFINFLPKIIRFVCHENQVELIERGKTATFYIYLEQRLTFLH